MKKRITFVGIILAVLMLMAVGVNYLLSLRKVTFDLQAGVASATVYEDTKEKIADINSDSNLLLQSGKYYAVPSGKNLSSDRISFTVDKEDKTVKIDPDYTKEYLRELLVSEEQSIKDAITSKYPSLVSGFTITNGSLYKKGEWFGALLKPIVDETREQKDPYRIVLKKSGNTWEVVRRPEYILTSSRFKDVPVDVLRSINSIVE